MSKTLYGPNGQPISSATYNKKAAAPALGERYGKWAGEEVRFMTLPGGGAIAFDLSKLTLSDYRQMKDHYQINSSLSVLTFMMHQMDWHIECEDKRIADFCEANLREVWSRLVRALSQSLWAGYSPNVLEWENDTSGRRIVLNKVKDLIPEDCSVKWDEVGSGTQKFKVYGGIRQWGSTQPIPVENSFWYPLLMENGNYYGKQILKSAFQPWFFSTLMHLFANRYYERFGEPVPVGRAPFDDVVTLDGKQVKGNELMAQILGQIRNRSVAVLPNEKTQFGDETTLDYDYQIEYLESQMRGADFERYMTRLDEEISLAMFTPILMMRTADVGSYNLGTQHNETYKIMLNAFGGDWAFYIDKYILRPMKRWNFGDRAPDPKIKFVKMGRVKAEILQAMLTYLADAGKIGFDVVELGELSGMTLREIQTVTETEPDPEPAPDQGTDSGSGDSPSDIGVKIVARIEQQVAKAFRTGTFGSTFSPSLGYRAGFEKSLREKGISNATSVTLELFNRIEDWMRGVIALGPDEFDSPDQFVRLFKATLDSEVERIVR